MDLFSPDRSLMPLPLDDGALSMLAQLPLSRSNEEVLAQLIAETAWKAETITVWGKRHLQPRLSAWYGDAAYTYSGLALAPSPFTPLQLEIKQALEQASGFCFNSVLLNYYRDGRDSMGMHSDDEAELGPCPAIASLSFGQTRTFILKHKRTGQSLKLDLCDGNLLLMSGETQKHWRHGINKETLRAGPRVNLTFRKII